MPNAIALDVSAETPCERCALFYALSRTENSRASFGRAARGACRTHGRGAWHHGPGAPGTTAEPAAPPVTSRHPAVEVDHSVQQDHFPARPRQRTLRGAVRGGGSKVLPFVRPPRPPGRVRHVL